MLTIRLSRRGKQRQISYRLIVSEKAKDPYGKSLEILGSYSPNTKLLAAKKDRINYWISKGAGTSDTVQNLLVKNNIIEGKKVRNSKYKKPEVVEKKEEKSTKTKEAPEVAEEPKEEIKEPENIANNSENTEK